MISPDSNERTEHMTREEYLAQLRALLTGRTPPDELERILAYYTEYFDEARPACQEYVPDYLRRNPLDLHLL